MQPVRPFLRWPGGKRRMADALAAEIAASGARTYVEPFLGAGAVALALPIERQVLSDVNRPLINLWRMIQRYPGAVASACEKAFDLYKNERDGYERARYEFNARTPFGIEHAGLMLYLNALCFNGVWRVNADNYFNVPFGDCKSARSITADETSAISMKLRNCELLYDDFRVIIPSAQRGHAIFADPPYDDGFAAYTADGFGPDDQRKLAVLLYAASLRGALVWSTNADTPFIRDIYAWADVEAIAEPRSVGATEERRAQVACVLIRSPKRP